MSGWFHLIGLGVSSPMISPFSPSSTSAYYPFSHLYCYCFLACPNTSWLESRAMSSIPLLNISRAGCMSSVKLKRLCGAKQLHVTPIQ